MALEKKKKTKIQTVYKEPEIFMSSFLSEYFMLVVRKAEQFRYPFPLPSPSFHLSTTTEEQRKGAGRGSYEEKELSTYCVMTTICYYRQRMRTLLES